MFMKKRPLSITLIGGLFIAAGAIGIAYHLPDLKLIGDNRTEVFLVFVLRALAILGGILLLAGQNWSRWLLMLWLAYHVALSVFHSRFEIIFHAVLLIIIAYFLFRPEATAYFQNQSDQNG